MDREVKDIDQQIIEHCAIAARRVYRRYANPNHGLIIDADDLRQELWIWSQRKRRKIDEWLDPEQDPRDARRNSFALQKTLMRQAEKICRTRKAKRLGFETRDEAFYSRLMVEKLLPLIWAITDDIGQAHEEGPKPPSNPSEGGNHIVSLFDVQRVLARLPEYDRKLLTDYYRDEIKPNELARQYECSRATIDRHLDKALDRLVDELGGESPWQR